MSLRVVRRAAGQLTVRDLIEALAGLGDPEMPVGVRWDDETVPALNVLLDEDERTGTWLVIE